MKTLTLAMFLCLLACIPARLSAQDRGFGLGLIIGEPTGISMKGWLNHTNAIDGAVAWSFAPKETSFHLHADYLWHSYNIFHTSEDIALYYGVGARFKAAHNNDARFGPRITVGLDYLPKSAPIDVFFEFAPIVDFAPSTELEMNAGLGARFFFK
jgi:hypothetical protein